VTEIPMTKSQLGVKMTEYIATVKCDRIPTFRKRHDIQHDSWHNDIQHNDTRHNNTQHNSILNTALSIMTLSIILLC